MLHGPNVNEPGRDLQTLVSRFPLVVLVPVRYFRLTFDWKICLRVRLLRLRVRLQFRFLVCVRVLGYYCRLLGHFRFHVYFLFHFLLYFHFRIPRRWNNASTGGEQSHKAKTNVNHTKSHSSKFKYMQQFTKLPIQLKSKNIHRCD